jgi:hypothetical protein
MRLQVSFKWLAGNVGFDAAMPINIDTTYGFFTCQKCRNNISSDDEKHQKVNLHAECY